MISLLCQRVAQHVVAALVLASSLVQAQITLPLKTSNLPSSSAAASHVVTTPHVRAELMAYAPDGVQLGKPFWLGLQIQHQPGWHTYWKNPGDSGLPTQLTWSLPVGIAAGAIDWPTPKKIPVANLANYGFEGALLLSSAMTVQSTFQNNGNEITVGLRAQWLVCRAECIPEEGTFSLKLPVRGSTAFNRALFESTRSALPKVHGGGASVEPQGAKLSLSVTGLPANWQGKVLEAFPEDPEMIETAAKPEQAWDKGAWRMTVPLSAQRSASPKSMAWVIKIAGAQSNPALRVNAPLQGAWVASPAVAASAPSPALEKALAENAAASAATQARTNAAIEDAPAPVASWLSRAFWLAVLGALVGGFILNLMPCVLPVLAIKILSFAPKKIIETKSSVAVVKIEATGDAVVHSDDTVSFRASSGLFAFGVIATFALLGAALLTLRAAGESFGWGFQLQSPGVVVGLALLFMLIGLNLFDLFELRMLLPQKLANFQAQTPSLQAIASGVLAVLVATPCTAPFMGASLGLAVALPAAQAMFIFVALGLGMALPFIVLTITPSAGAWLLKTLPAPGAWMQVLRHFLAWPIFATVIWLLWVYAQQTSINSAFAVMLLLLNLIALMWVTSLRAGWARNAIALVFTACLALTLLLWGNVMADTAIRVDQPAPQKQVGWSGWSVQAQQEARANGRTVFVDFTAAWCVTCQVNKSSTLNRDEVLAAFKEKNVLMLRADWTKPDAAIAAELAKLGRTGLPVYAVYKPSASAPQLLSEVLTVDAVIAALQ